jgi:uridine kinase
VLLTLTGGAGAGKTTLAAALAATTPRAPIHVLHGDDYYFTAQDRGVWAYDGTGVPRLDVGDPRSMDIERLNHATDHALSSAAIVVDGLFAQQRRPAGAMRPVTRVVFVAAGWRW